MAAGAGAGKGGRATESPGGSSGRKRAVGKAKLQTVQTVSAGGVIFRRSTDTVGKAGYEIVLVGQSRVGRWGLPKGAPATGETLEEAALREVREETGIEGRIVAPLGAIEYWFWGRGVRYHKMVHFHLMEALGGDLSRHDYEHDVVGWFTIPDAYQTMSYANEKEVVRRAEAILGRRERAAS